MSFNKAYRSFPRETLSFSRGSFHLRFYLSRLLRFRFIVVPWFQPRRLVQRGLWLSRHETRRNEDLQRYRVLSEYHYQLLQAKRYDIIPTVYGHEYLPPPVFWTRTNTWLLLFRVKATRIAFFFFLVHTRKKRQEKIAVTCLSFFYCVRKQPLTEDRLWKDRWLYTTTTLIIPMNIAATEE